MGKYQCGKYEKAGKRYVAGTISTHGTFAEANHKATEILNSLGELGRKEFSAMIEPIE